MQTVNELSSYVSKKSFAIFPTVMNSLPVGVLSFSLICESIAVQFLTFVPHGVKTFVEEDSPSSRATKSSFVRRPANFGDVSFF